MEGSGVMLALGMFGVDVGLGEAVAPGVGEAGFGVGEAVGFSFSSPPPQAESSSTEQTGRISERISNFIIKMLRTFRI